jgi:3-hydroxyisobutyrate dehydrogenase-like beta-hydroxyacid dehydrogenase
VTQSSPKVRQSRYWARKPPLKGSLLQAILHSRPLLAFEFLPLSRVQRKAMFVDCNAVNVETVRRISSIIEPTGASFVDGSIIGHPPGPEGGPTFYFSGSAAKELAAFEGLGLKVRIMEAPIGAASALKMAYAGINEGITLLVTAMVLGAARAGVADALHEPLAELGHLVCAVDEASADEEETSAPRPRPRGRNRRRDRRPWLLSS